jgi:S-adenosylmethionine:tRNA ribosyltransferase-isomerase
MIAAHLPQQRPAHAKLLVLDACGRIRQAPRSHWLDYLRRGDLIVANDAATLPASLHGRHETTGAPIEVRLAGLPSLSAKAFGRFTAVLFGAGDYHIPTENRPAPPTVVEGDRLLFGPLIATVEKMLGHARFMQLRFDGKPEDIWAGLAQQGRPIQYAHMRQPLALWDVWTPIAGFPVAFEPPSAAFALDWKLLAEMRARGIAFASLTHAAGISSTGDATLDARLPLPEPYRIPATTVAAIIQARATGRRVVAVGTTVVRALEHSATRNQGLPLAGDGVADQRLGADSNLQVADAILSGTHEVDTSHYQLLRAFADDADLRRVNYALEQGGYRTHEFGDSVLIERRCADCVQLCAA